MPDRMSGIYLILFLWIFAAGLWYAVRMPCSISPKIKSHFLEIETVIPSVKSIFLSSVNWEELTLSDPVLKDWTTVAFSPRSTITLRDMKNSYHVGDVIKLDITVKDYFGQKRRRGGDLVRIWIKDPSSGACAVGHVVDNQDGSYQGTVKLLWNGNITVVGRIAAPREMAGFLYDCVRSERTVLLMKGYFESGSTYESKGCSPYPDRFVSFCNLTARNSDLPWYCEKPQYVSCNDWRSNAWYYSHVEYTPQEIEMFKRINQYNAMDEKIHLTVNGATNNNKWSHRVSKLRPCNELPGKSTWTSPIPGGYLYKGVWHSVQCRSTFDGSVTSFETCLRGRKLWLLGDSTLRQFFRYLGRILNLHLTTETWTRRFWHKPSTEINTDKNITVFWGLHALPFYNSDGFDDIDVKGTHLYIDRIPANSRDVVVIHFYMHFMAHHPDILRYHVQKVKTSIRALKSRASEVKILVKGPHAFHDEKDGVGMFYDFWGTVYDNILREEFESITNDVIFLDVWEITMSAENWDRHPNETLIRPMINNMMSYIC